MSDLPIKHISQEHMEMMLAKSSISKKVVWPDFKTVEGNCTAGDTITSQIHAPRSDSNEATATQMNNSSLEDIAVKPLLEDQKSGSNDPMSGENEVTKSTENTAMVDGNQNARQLHENSRNKEGNDSGNADQIVDVLEDTGADQWKLNKVMTIAELTKGRWPKKCSTEGCNLKAAVEYLSTVDSTSVRSYCLDCQVRTSSALIVLVGRFRFISL